MTLDDENPNGNEMQLVQLGKKKLCSEKNAHCICERYWKSNRWQQHLAMGEEKHLKKETERVTMPTQDQSLRTRWVKHYIDRTTVSPRCRICEKINENVSHIVWECNKLAQNEYKKLRHDQVPALLYWQWCKTYEFKVHEKTLCWKGKESVTKW